MRAIDCQQYTPEWWDVRRGIPTASRAKDIITPSKGEYSKSADAYICELIADRYDPMYGQYEGYQTAAMKNGTILEPQARQFYGLKRGAKVVQIGFCISDDGRAGCSPDGLIGEDGLIELKSPEPKTHVKYLLSGELPLEYKPQCHWHLVVTGRAWCDFMSYCPGFPSLLIMVEPDAYTQAVREAMLRFCDALDIEAKKLQAMIGDAPAKRASVVQDRAWKLSMLIAQNSDIEVVDICRRYKIEWIGQLTEEQIDEEIKLSAQAAF